MSKFHRALTTEDTRTLEQTLPALDRFARSLTGDPVEAEDVLQSCIERAIRKFDLFRQGTNMRKWLFAILYNEFINQTRRRKRRAVTVPIEEWRGDVAIKGNQESAIELQELGEAFDELPRQDRNVLYLVGVEGKSYKETSRILDVKIGTVKSRLSRARERLRSKLEDGGEKYHAA